MVNKRRTIVPSIIETDSMGIIMDYGTISNFEIINTNLNPILINDEPSKESVNAMLNDINAEKLIVKFNQAIEDGEPESENTQLKYGWLQDFSELYSEKLYTAFGKYINIVPKHNDKQTFFGMDADYRFTLYNVFFSQMFFNLWRTILYSPDIIPSSKEQVCEADLNLMSDLIDEQLVAISAFRILTQIYQNDFSDINDYTDKEAIIRNLILLEKIQKQKGETTDKPKSAIRTYIFKVILGRYKSDNLTANLDEFFNEFKEVLPEINAQLNADNEEEINNKHPYCRLPGYTWKSFYNGVNKYRKDLLKAK